MRTSSEEYNLDSSQKDNIFIHLTNNAVQQFNKNYGQFENGNQLSFPQFEVTINFFYKNRKKLIIIKFIFKKIKFLSINKNL